MIRSERLRVIPEPADPAQDCSTCETSRNCWKAGIKEEHIITNLLVCRIKRGIDVNRSAKLFLQMVRPKLKALAHAAVRGTNIDVDVALADMESQTIEQVMRRYMMGEIGYPLHFLFGMPNGVMGHYASNYAKKTRNYEDVHILENVNDEETAAPEPEPDVNEVTQLAREVVDDGLTLSLSEYRVLKFCLSNASEAKRPVNGLHVYIARQMDIVRGRASRLAKDATEKMVAEVRNRV